MRASMRCSAISLPPSVSTLEPALIELGERGEVARARASERSRRAKASAERGSAASAWRSSDWARVDPLFGLVEAILREGAGDEQEARLAGAVAQRLTGALGGVRGACPVALVQRQVGEAEQRRHVRRQALDRRLVAGARVVGAIELDQRLGGAREHDGGGARVVGRGVGERAGDVGLLRQIVAGAGARVDVAQRRAAAAILGEREAIVVVDGGAELGVRAYGRPRRRLGLRAARGSRGAGARDRGARRRRSRHRRRCSPICS